MSTEAKECVLTPYYVRTFDRKYLNEQFIGRFTVYTTASLRVEYDQSKHEVVLSYPGHQFVLSVQNPTHNSEQLILPAKGKGWRAEMIKQKLHFEIGMVRLTIMESEVTVEHLDQTLFNGICGNNDPFMSGSQVDAEMIPISDVSAFFMSWAQHGQLKRVQPAEPSNQAVSVCQSIFRSEAFRSCRRFQSIVPYVRSCQIGLESNDENAHCDTARNYAVECARNGQEVSQWWSDKLCPKSCPSNQVYRQHSADCLQTCSGQVSGHCDVFSDGCSCPEGMIYQDIPGAESFRSCVYSFDCPCTHEDRTFVNGEIYHAKCEQCTCNHGAWSCQAKPCPGECHIDTALGVTQYDGKSIGVHNDCSYILSWTDSWQVIGHFEHGKLRYTDIVTAGQIISLDGSVVRINDEDITLPHSSTLLTIQSDGGYSVLLESILGLSVISTQEYTTIIIDQKWRERTTGLCGIFNDDSSDDLQLHLDDRPFKIASKFVAAWSTTDQCHSKPKTVIGRSARQQCIDKFVNVPIFSECVDYIDFDHFTFICENRAEEDSVCDIFASALSICQNRRPTLDLTNWRNETNCQKQCPLGQGKLNHLDNNLKPN